MRKVNRLQLTIIGYLTIICYTRYARPSHVLQMAISIDFIQQMLHLRDMSV